MAGIIEVKDQGKVRIYDADNSNYIDIVVPSTVSSNRTITIPDATFTIPTSGGADDGSITKAKLADQVDVFSGTSLNAADLGAGVHIKTADTGASVSTDADELVVEGTRSGMTFLAANNNYSYINFGDDGGSGSGSIRYGHPNNDLTFYTNGADQWTLDSSGNFLPSATDHGIYLGVTSATAANLLDDYEEGTYTPVVTFGVGSSGITYNSGATSGIYTKVGRLVCVAINITMTSKGSSSGTAEVSLPFTPASFLAGHNHAQYGMASRLQHLAVAAAGMAFRVRADSAKAYFQPMRNGTSPLATYGDNSDFANNTTLSATLTYATS